MYVYLYLLNTEFLKTGINGVIMVYGLSSILDLPINQSIHPSIHPLSIDIYLA